MSEILEPTDCKSCVFRTWAFNKLTDEELGLINRNKKEFFYEKGEVICREGAPIEHFLYLQKGLVKLYKTESNNKEHIISIAKPMDFIGLLSIFSNTKHIHAISALEKSTICFVDLNIIKQLMKKNGEFALDFIEKISKVSDNVLNTRLNINTKQLRGRIAFILQFFANHIYGNNHFELPISRKEIAQLIDMSTENVIRILSEFRKDGIINIEGKNITINQPERLQKIYALG